MSCCCCLVTDPIHRLFVAYQLPRPAFTSVHMQHYQHHTTPLPPGHLCNPAVTGLEHTRIDDGLLGTLFASDNGPLLQPKALRTMQLGKDANAVSSLPTTAGVLGCRGVHIQDQSSDIEERAHVGRLKTLLGSLLASDFSPLLKTQALLTMQQDAHDVSLSTTAGLCGVQYESPSSQKLQQHADVQRLMVLLDEKAIVINHLREENERLRRALDSRQEQTREIRMTTHSTETQLVTGMEMAGSFPSPSAEKQMSRRRTNVYENRFELKEEADLIRFWFERRFDHSIKSRTLWRLAVKKVIVLYCLPHVMLHSPI